MDARIFERHDPISGDALQVGLDGGRLTVRTFVEGKASTLVLVDEADVRRLADALVAALESEGAR